MVGSPNVQWIRTKKGNKIHRAVYTLGWLPVAHVTPAKEQEHIQVRTLAVDTVSEFIVGQLSRSQERLYAFPRKQFVEGYFAWTAHFYRRHMTLREH